MIAFYWATAIFLPWFKHLPYIVSSQPHNLIHDENIFEKTYTYSLIILYIGFLIPQNLKMPVVGAGSHSYNHETFWYGGWGSSIIHKGVDILPERARG